MKKSLFLTLFNFCNDTVFGRKLLVNWHLNGFNRQGGSYGRDGVCCD